ncbi:MAG: YitT family protein [Reinekea sp.]
MQSKQHHSILEDLFALMSASLVFALGIYLLKYGGFLTGGTAGIALILSHIVPFSFGQIFFVINLPFYYFAWVRMGKRFTFNTFISVALVSVLSDHLPDVIRLESLNPIFAAFLGGALLGIGVLILFRHVSSLGGLGVLSKYLQDRLNISAGRFQMAVDVSIVVVGYFLVSVPILLYSILAAIVMNMVIALNHKPGRYQVT